MVVVENYLHTLKAFLTSHIEHGSYCSSDFCCWAGTLALGMTSRCVGIYASFASQRIPPDPCIFCSLEFRISVEPSAKEELVNDVCYMRAFKIKDLRTIKFTANVGICDGCKYLLTIVTT